MLSEVRDVLNSINDMQQLNFELLEELNLACKWLLENKVEVPNKEKFVSLLNKADSLIEELSSESPQFSIRRKVTEPESDGEVTEPNLCCKKEEKEVILLVKRKRRKKGKRKGHKGKKMPPKVLMYFKLRNQGLSKSAAKKKAGL